MSAGRVAYFGGSAVRRKWWEQDNSERQANAADIESHDTAFAYGGPPKPNLNDPSAFYRTQPVVDRRIYVLGMGPLGRFMAHALRGIANPPPVTLLFNSARRLDDWTKSSQKISLVTGGCTEKNEGYDAEIAYPRPRLHGKDLKSSQDPGHQDLGPLLREGESGEPINSLIVCCRPTKVLQALSAVKHRLHKDSVVLFMQRGMGIVEEVNREIFPDPETRPRYMLGVDFHGIHLQPDDSCGIVHSSFGTMALGLLPHERERQPGPYAPLPKFAPYSGSAESTNPADPDPDTPAPRDARMRWTTNDRYLLRTLLRTPVLCATGFSPPDLLQLQLEKLAVDSIVGPLTCMLDARMGSLLYNYALTRTMRLLLSEISLVIRSLPELQYIPNVAQRFDSGRLENMVIGNAQKGFDSISSMLRDVRDGRQTDIDYLNGWIVDKGEEMGVRCFMNYMMLNLVKGKQNMITREMGEEVPFLFEREKQGEGSIRIGGAGGEGTRLEDD